MGDRVFSVSAATTYRICSWHSTVAIAVCVFGFIFYRSLWSLFYLGYLRDFSRSNVGLWRYVDFWSCRIFGSGGYLVAIFTTRSGWFLPIPLWPALLLALCVVAGFAFLLASLVFRGRMPLRGIEFAVITLAIAYLLEQYARAGGEITGGQNGILFEDNLEIFNFDLHRGRGFYALAGISLL